jgi:hypothetical protein
MHSPFMHGKYKGAPQCPLRGVVGLGAKRENMCAAMTLRKTKNETRVDINMCG